MIKKLVLLSLAFLLLLGVYYVGDTYKPTFDVNKIQYIETNNSLILEGSSDTAIIFYPGAKVEPEAYLSLLETLNDELGVWVYVMKMPLNFAILNPNSANQIIKQSKHNHYILMGHSLGGAMASQYASNNDQIIEKLILLGAYPYKSFDPEKTLSIYGSLEEKVKEKNGNTLNKIEIQGGNHAQFAEYGNQQGDPQADISLTSQHQQTLEAITNFIGR